jgi:hypothetical protein
MSGLILVKLIKYPLSLQFILTYWTPSVLSSLKLFETTLRLWAFTLEVPVSDVKIELKIETKDCMRNISKILAYVLWPYRVCYDILMSLLCY